MTEQAIAAAAAPIEAAALEELHQLASAEIERLEKTLPPRLAAAEQDVQDWAHDAVTTLHGLVARIDQHRQGASTTPAAAALATNVPPGNGTTTSQTVAVATVPSAVPAPAVTPQGAK